MLVQEVAAQVSPDRVTFVSENFGASKLADKYGVKGYPAVFVDGVLVASPREFGYFGEMEGTGRYAPWRNAASQAKFKADLTRMIDLILAGRKDIVSQEHPSRPRSRRRSPRFRNSHSPISPASPSRPSSLRAASCWSSSGRPGARRAVPPSQWLGELKQKYGDKLAVVALAVESPEAGIRTTAASLSPDLRWAITDAATAQAFGDITAVPTLFLFDRSGKTAQRALRRSARPARAGGQSPRRPGQGISALTARRLPWRGPPR